MTEDKIWRLCRRCWLWCERKAMICSHCGKPFEHTADMEEKISDLACRLEIVLPGDARAAIEKALQEPPPSWFNEHVPSAADFAEGE